MRKICLLGLLLLLPTTATQAGITLDHVDGLNANGGIEDGATLTFHMRFTNTYDDPLVGVDNGYRFYSYGLTWSSLSGEWNPAYNWNSSYGEPFFFDFGPFTNVYGDTIGFAGVSYLDGTGIPPGFDDIAYTITLGPISAEEGGWLTLDSSWYPPACAWEWHARPPGGLAIPVECSWGGPYTFLVIPEITCTYVVPDPIDLKEITQQTVVVHIIPWRCGVDIEDINLQTIRVNGKVPPYTEPVIENDHIIFDVFLMRLLSFYRPIVAGGPYDYFVSFSTYSSGPQQLQGEFELVVTDGDVTLDGKTDIDDVSFLVDYLWRGGPPCLLQEMMDVNKNGQVNSADVAALKDLVY